MALDLDGVVDQSRGDRINNGVWVHLDSMQRDPSTGAPVPWYLDPDQKTKPVRALVRSVRCQAIKVAETKMQRGAYVKIRLAKKAVREQVIADNTVLPEEQRFGLVLASVENFSAKNPGIRTVEVDDGIAIYNEPSLAHMVAQIVEFANDDSNFMSADEAKAQAEADRAAAAEAARRAEAGDPGEKTGDLTQS